MIKKNLPLIFLFFLPLVPQAFAQDIRTAKKLFADGKLSESAAMLEVIYLRDKSEETKELFVKTLVNLGTELIFKEQYSAALVVFGRAEELKPSDKTILELFDTTRELLSLDPQETEEQEQPQTLPPVEIPPDILRNQKKLMRKMEALINTFEKNAKKPDKLAGKTLEKMDDLLEAGRKTNKALEESFSKSEKTLKRTLFAYASLFTVVIVLILSGTYLIMRRATLKRQALLSKFLEEKKKMEVPLIEGQAGKKFQGIDIIEVELSVDNQTEVSVARNLLKPFLNDPDIEIRIRAIKTLYKYSKQDAEEIALALAGHENTEFRKAFCRLTNLVTPEKSIAVLGKLIKEEDMEIKRSVLKSLVDMQSMKISEDMKEKITELLKNETPDDWIVT